MGVVLNPPVPLKHAWTLVPVSSGTPRPSRSPVPPPSPSLQGYGEALCQLGRERCTRRSVCTNAKKKGGKFGKLGITTPPPDRWDLEGPGWGGRESDKEGSDEEGSDEEGSDLDQDWKVSEDEPLSRPLRVVLNERGEAYELAPDELDRPMTDEEVKQEEERLRARRQMRIEERIDKAAERRAWKNRKRVIQLTKKGTYKRQERKAKREVERAQEAGERLAALKEAFERRQKKAEAVEVG